MITAPYGRVWASFRTLHSTLTRKPYQVVMILDLETNGLSFRDSVLSVTAEKYCCTYPNLELMDRFHRFYFSREPANPQAIQVNGLDWKTIEAERQGKDWPLYFDEDPEFPAFSKGVEIVVGHNISFDLKFLPFLRGIDTFCTMKSHTCGKYPSLHRLSSMYGLAVDSTRLHNGEYDVELTVGIFRKILLDLYAGLNFEGR